jgi:hypothetical protein
MYAGFEGSNPSDLLWLGAAAMQKEKEGDSSKPEHDGSMRLCSFRDFFAMADVVLYR